MSINFKDIKPEEFKIIPNSIIERVENDRFCDSFSSLDSDSTYFDLINKISDDLTCSMQSIFKSVDIFDLQNHGLPQFYFIVILHAILAEGVLRSISKSFLMSSPDQESIEDVCIDNFNESLNHVLKLNYLLGYCLIKNLILNDFEACPNLQNL